MEKFRGLDVPLEKTDKVAAHERRTRYCNMVEGYDGCLGVSCNGCIFSYLNIDAFIAWEKERNDG